MRYRFAPILISAVMFLVGACGLVYEYSLGFLGNNLIGSSHEQIYLVIAIMMFAMGVGAFIQQHLFKTKLMDKFLYVEITLALLGGFSVLGTYTAYAFMASFTVVLYAFAFAMGVLIGAEIPLIMRVNQEHEKTLCPKLNVILGLDYVGALLGAIVFVYFMLPKVSVDRIVFILALLNVMVGVVALIYFWKLIHQKIPIIIYSAFVIVALLASLVFSQDMMATLEQRVYRDRIIFRHDTPYQHLVITKSRKDDTRLYINGQLQFSSKDEHIYHEMLVHVPMTAAKDPKRVLILGGGDGMALREVLKYDVESVTLVDLDPVMTHIFANEPELSSLNQDAFNDARVYHTAGTGVTPGEKVKLVDQSHLSRLQLDHTRYEVGEVRVLNVDADAFIRDINGTYDLVVIDFPDPSTLELCKLYSVDFYRLLRRRLAPNALIALQSASPYHAKEVFLCIGKTLHAAGFQVMPYQRNVHSFGGWGWHLAWTDDRDHQEILARLEATEIPVETRYVTNEVMLASFIFGKDELDTSGIRVNTKMSPVILQYYERSWQR